MGCNTSQEQNAVVTPSPTPNHENDGIVNGMETEAEVEDTASSRDQKSSNDGGGGGGDHGGGGDGDEKSKSTAVCGDNHERSSEMIENGRNDVVEMKSKENGDSLPAPPPPLIVHPTVTINITENGVDHQPTQQEIIDGLGLEGSQEEEDAAKKIQAVFRGHKSRVTTTMKQGDAVEPHHDEPEQTKEELEAEFDPNDKELCNAAIRIQSTFRGHLARKSGNNEPIKPEEFSELTKQVAEELDIDLNDPELHKAASKIQASFRGHKSRGDGPNDVAK